MPQDYVSTPQRKLDDLDHELSRRLRHGMITQATAIPLARPPSLVRLIMLELTCQKDRDEDFLNSPLDGDDSDEAKNSMRRIPQLEEPLRTRRG